MTTNLRWVDIAGIIHACREDSSLSEMGLSMWTECGMVITDKNSPYVPSIEDLSCKLCKTILDKGK